MNGVEYRDGFGSESPDDLIDLATGDMYAAVARRKAVAARADFGLLRSMVLGTQATPTQSGCALRRTLRSPRRSTWASRPPTTRPNRRGSLASRDNDACV